MLIDSLGNKPASWVIVNKSTGLCLFETFNIKIAQAINQNKYDVLPIYDYLAKLNRSIKHD
jgi:hypothetical protein